MYIEVPRAISFKIRIISRKTNFSYFRSS